MILSFDIGGTFIKYGIIDDDHSFHMKSMVETQAHLGGQHIIEQIIQISNTLKQSYTLDGIAISSAGVIEPFLGIVLSATDAIPNYVGINIKQMVEHGTHVMTTVENDVNCAALAESRLAVEPIDELIALTIGTGIGGAIIYQGQLIRGHAFSAGEWGKMYITGKHFEKLASINALIQDAIDHDLMVHDGESLFRMYDQGNIIAHAVVHRFYHFLSLGIANLIFTLNPKVIVIGGGISNRKDKFIEEISQILRLHLPSYYVDHVEIRLPKYFNDAGMLGAYLHHMDIKKST
jgi:predicted NBD/HSP70 family sugar kinase